MSLIGTLIQQFFQRVKALVRNSRGDLDDELRFHIEQSIRIKVEAGMNPTEARRESMVEFGGVERAREESWRARPSWLFETVGQDIRLTLRDFRRHPGFTATVVATLALGLGTATAVLSVVDPILFRALPYADSGSLVSVGLTAPIIPEEFMLGGSFYVWRDNQKAFESFTSETGVSACDLTELNPARLNCASVEGNFLSTLGVPIALGRDFLPEEDRPNGPKVAILSHAIWQSHFGGDPGVINRLVDIDGVQTRVVGVLPKSFEMPTMEAADVLRPQALDEAEQRKADPGRVMFVFARLKPGVDASHASSLLEPLFQYSLQLAPPAFRNEVHLRVRSLRDRQMERLQRSAWVLLGAVLAVLLIACGNVASLLLARAVSRERELAVRIALGAGRGRLTRQSLTETLLVSMSGVVAGWILAMVLLRVFVAIAPAGLTILDKAHLDLRIVGFTILLGLACAALLGAMTAIRLPKTVIAETLAARTSGSVTSAWLRKGLVVTQIAMSIVLLAASSLLARSFWNQMNQNLGMRTRGILAARIELGRERYSTPQSQMQFFRRAEAALRVLPGVTAVGISDSLPPTGRHGESILNVMQVVGHPRTMSGTGGMVAWRSITPDYLRVLGVRVIAGREFNEMDRSSPEHILIINKLLSARLFPGEDPARSALGQRIQPSPNSPFFTIVGVAANVKNAGLTGNDEPEYYRLRRNNPEDWNGSSVLTLTTSLSPTALKQWVRTQIAEIDPTVPVDVSTLEDSVSELAAAPRFEAALISFFSLCGLVMAALGLYGVISFIVARRTSEIGVRMALGASRSCILVLVARQGLRLILIGGILGIAGASAATELLRGLLFGIGPRDPATMAAVFILLTLVGMAATLIPARRAMQVDTVKALRCE